MSASPACSLIASKTVEALPSWRYGARARKPHKGAVRISSGCARGLGYSVTQASHMMQEKIGIERNVLERQGSRDRAGLGLAVGMGRK